MITAYIGLGSNLGAREENLREAVSRLDLILENAVCSSFHESEAVDAEGRPDSASPAYLNAAIRGEFPGTPRELFAALQDIEIDMGRDPEEKSRYRPRVIDLDLLVVEKDGRAVCLQEPDFILPHPRMRDRPFVMVPLREIGFLR